MISEGVVEESASPWSSPVVMVRKRDGSYRFCVDFRKVNAITERDAYPLPYISSILDKLRDARYLTTIYIKAAYWQIPMKEESKQYTAFVVPHRGLYQFRRMPFGLHNAPATFQRLIDSVLGHDLEPYMFPYLDDVIIVTSSFEEHRRILKVVLERLQSAGLSLNQEKCHFCKQELRYLGYVVNQHGLLVDPEKVKAITDIPRPRSLSEVRRIIGMASWYRRFVPDFSTLIAPMTALLRKNHSFHRTEECEDSFDNVKAHLVSAPILSCPNFDASGYGVAGVLTQTYPDGERVISYISRYLTRLERNYSTTERECLAVLFAIEKFRPYVEASSFTVVSDNYSLKWLNSIQHRVLDVLRVEP